MIITVTLNPALDKTLQVTNFTPGGLNRVEAVDRHAGGKGVNVAKAVRSLGKPCVATGFLGGTTGDFIERQLKEIAVICDFIRVDAPTRTNIKITDSQTGITTELNEPGAPVSPEAFAEFEQRLFARVEEDDIVVLSGRLLPLMDPDTYARLIRRLLQTGAEVILDTDGEALRRGVLEGPTAIKPNLHELENLARRPLRLTREIVKESQKLLDYGIQTVLVSMGERGAVLVSRGGVILSPSIPVPVGSTVGAGDSMVAAMAVSRSEGAFPENTLRLATAAATASVMSGQTGLFDTETARALLPKVQTEIFL